MSNKSDWNSNQYMKFAAERTQPSRDLISRLCDLSPKRVLDIGCGPGNSTAALKNRFPDAEIIGVDASDNMLEKAQATYPDMHFEKYQKLVPSAGRWHDYTQNAAHFLHGD